jgi:hypothetical protein
MLGTFPVAEYPAAMSAGRWFHDGFWINRYNWLLDDAHGRKSLEIPDSSRDDAWKSLTNGNRRLDHEERKRFSMTGKSTP